MNQLAHHSPDAPDTPLVPDSQEAWVPWMRCLFEHSTLRVVVSDHRFRLLYANSASCLASGYSCDELKALAPHQWRTDPSPRMLVRELVKPLRRGQYVIKRLSHCRPDGGFWQEERLWLPLIFAPEARQPLILSIGWDVEAMLANEVRTVRNESMRAMLHLMAGLSHEFNNLLGSINGLAELNQMLLSETHPAFENSRHIQAAGERAAALIDDMTLCGGSFQLNYQPSYPRDLMLSALQRCRLALGQHPETRLLFDNAPESVTLDAPLVEHALAHVIENALHAMEATPAPCLWLKVGRGTLPEGLPCLELGVGDNGTGMDKKTQSRMFNSFFTTKAPGKGRGLGMVMVNACALLHGGDVQITSVPGEGSEVTLLIPLKPVQHGYMDDHDG